MEREVRTAIDKLTNRIAVGDDEITGEIFIQNEECICKVIMELFGIMGNCSKVSKKWVIGVATFI